MPIWNQGWSIMSTVAINFLLTAIQVVSHNILNFNEFKNCDPSFNQTAMNPWACRVETRSNVVVEKVNYNTLEYLFTIINQNIPTPVYQNDIVILHTSCFYMMYHVIASLVILGSTFDEKYSIWTYFISVQVEYAYMLNFLVDIMYMYNVKKRVVIIWIMIFECNDRVSFHDISDSEEMRKKFMHSFYCKKRTNPVVYIFLTAFCLYQIYIRDDADFHMYRLACVAIIYISMAQIRYSVLVYMFNGKRTQFVRAIMDYNHVFSKALERTSNFYLNYTDEVDDDVINFKLSDLFSKGFRVGCLCIGRHRVCAVSKFYKNLKISVGHNYVEHVRAPAAAGAPAIGAPAAPVPAGARARAQARAPASDNVGIGLVRASVDDIASAIAVADSNANANAGTNIVSTRTAARRRIIEENTRVRNEIAQRRSQLVNGGENVGWIFDPFTTQELNSYTRDQSCVYFYPPTEERSYMRYWVLFSSPPEGGMPATFSEFLSMLMRQGFKKNILCFMFTYTAPVNNELEVTLDGAFHVTKSRTF
eukprot:765736-Hanusia_phi.AAC.6